MLIGQANRFKQNPFGKGGGARPMLDFPVGERVRVRDTARTGLDASKAGTVLGARSTPCWPWFSAGGGGTASAPPVVRCFLCARPAELPFWHCPCWLNRLPGSSPAPGDSGPRREPHGCTASTLTQP